MMAADGSCSSQTLAHSNKGKVWIDLDNTPHVPFFKPIIAELHRRGYETVVTARDAFQVYALAQRMQVPCLKVGRHHGKNRLMKASGLLYRACQLMPIVAREKPALALSHGSRSQAIAAKILRIRSMGITDYEFARPFPLVCPKWLLMPDAIPDERIRLRDIRVLKYPGIKEDVYVPGFKPDATILTELGISPDSDRLTVTVRPPATEAHYHSPKSERLFASVMEHFCDREDVNIVLLPRNQKQTEWMRRTWPHWFECRRLIIPDHAVDGLNLVWHSDLVVSGGGTMNREAAALGIPVYSIFRGTIGAVDTHLVEAGRLVLLEDTDDVRTKIRLIKRHGGCAPDPQPRPAFLRILEHIEYVAGLHRNDSVRTGPCAVP